MILTLRLWKKNNFRFYHLIEVVYLRVGPILIQFINKIEKKYFFSQTQRENHYGQS